MNKLFNVRMLSFLCFVAFIGTVTSCRKNDVQSGRVELLSFGPTGAKHGDTLLFIGKNLSKVSSIEFTGNTSVVDKNNFVSQSEELIKLIVPTSAEKGFVTLKTSDGDIVSKTILNLNVLTSVTSITAQARPGENITITGNYLNWVTRIMFARDKLVTTFVSKSINQIVVTVPADAETGPLILSFGGTDSADVQTADTLKVTLPISTSFSPNPVKHAEDLTITGTNLDLVEKIIFTGVASPVASFVSKTATQIVVKVPASTTKGTVKLEAASGIQTTSTADLDVALPAITSMAPNAVDPLADLTITGTNLDLVSGVAFVGVTNAVTSFVSQTATQLVVNVPAAAITGKLTLNVKNSTLSVKSANDLAIVGSSVPPIIIYDDALSWSGWVGGGWGGTKDLDNTSPVQSGSKSCRISYVGDYGVPLQLGGANISLAGYTSLKVSIYGGAGSNNQNVNIGFNETDGKTITIVEGQWTEFTIPLSEISAASTLSFLYFKKYTAAGGADFTIYLDNLGIY